MRTPTGMCLQTRPHPSLPLLAPRPQRQGRGTRGGVLPRLPWDHTVSISALIYSFRPTFLAGLRACSPWIIDRLPHAGMYPWSRPDLPWTQGLSTGFADVTASWIWNEHGAGLSARAGEVVRFYRFIDRDRLMERDAPSHRALLHIIADGDTACTVRFNNATLGVFTGGYDNKNYTKYAVDLSQVHPSSTFLS